MKISYYGYLTPFGGYGIANINWIKHLKRAGVNVSVDAKFRAYPGTDEWNALTPEERKIFTGMFEVRDVGIVETTPDNFFVNKSKVKIANTMAETDMIGKSWVDNCNKMDHLIVPNDFYKKVFINSGVEVPIEVIPHGVDTKTFKYKSRANRGSFVFGMCGYLNNRKSVFEVIRAFSSEFEYDEDVRLRLHTTDPDLWFYKNLRDKRIQITNRLWSKEGVRRFYESLNCFVFPSKAEGIGYPPREAMATGIPSIVMNYSGLEEISNDEYNYVIHPAGWEYTNPMEEQPGRWATVDIKELMYWMRHAFEHQNEVRKKGLIASKKMKEQSWEKCTNKLIDYLGEIHEMHGLQQE